MSLNQLRLSLMIEYNQIGSLTSLGKHLHEHPSIKRTRSNSMRRGSYSIGMFQPARGSASKVDLLKSAVEVSNGKNFNALLKNSSGHLSGVNNNVKVSQLLFKLNEFISLISASFNSQINKFIYVFPATAIIYKLF